jgi:hypothetical protein
MQLTSLALVTIKKKIERYTLNRQKTSRPRAGKKIKTYCLMQRIELPAVVGLSCCCGCAAAVEATVVSVNTIHRSTIQ